MLVLPLRYFFWLFLFTSDPPAFRRYMKLHIEQTWEVKIYFLTLTLDLGSSDDGLKNRMFNAWDVVFKQTLFVHTVTGITGN